MSELEKRRKEKQEKGGGTRGATAQGRIQIEKIPNAAGLENLVLWRFYDAMYSNFPLFQSYLLTELLQRRRLTTCNYVVSASNLFLLEQGSGDFSRYTGAISGAVIPRRLNDFYSQK